MINPEVSILVPVYNVSNSIERCARSLFRQTFEDIEYVFVNDATPDDSMKKLRAVITQYPNREKQVKIINHTQNKGIAITRNTAIVHSAGRYLLFADSDDYIEPEMIEILYNKAEEEQADMVVSDLIMEYLDRKTCLFTEEVADNWETNFKNMIEHKIISSSSCNKLIVRRLYEKKECRMIAGLNYCEDWHVMIRLFFYAGKIVKVNQAFYHYTHSNENSITSSKKRMHFENILQFWNLLDSFLIEHNMFSKYQDIIGLSKLQTKINLMFDTDIPALRGEYADMFLAEEKKYFSQLKPVDKLMFFFIHHKMLAATQFIRKLLIVKHKILRYLF
jgi:glycosyltransferase involved in cell wall biosynthesis